MSLIRKREDNDIFGRKPLPPNPEPRPKPYQDHDILKAKPLTPKPYKFLQNHKHNDIFGSYPKFTPFYKEPSDLSKMMRNSYLFIIIYILFLIGTNTLEMYSKMYYF
jgi:hypothetical protein